MMLRKLGIFAAGFIIFWLWSKLVIGYYICGVKGWCEPPLPDIDSLQLASLPNTLELRARGKAIITGYPQFYFDYSSSQPVLTDRHRQFLEETAAYLKEPHKARLEIKGYYLQSESKDTDSKYQNLGQVRALAIADKIIKEYKVEPQLILTKGELLLDTVLKSPLKFELINYQLAPSQLFEEEEANFREQWEQDLNNELVYTSINADFNYQTKKLKPSKALEDYSQKLKAFLMDNPDYELLLIGHTDTQCPEKECDRLALSHAQALANYLKQQGIKVSIKLESKGASSPLVEDLLSDGSVDSYAKAKNRRVNILLKAAN